MWEFHPDVIAFIMSLGLSQYNANGISILQLTQEATPGFLNAWQGVIKQKIPDEG